MPRRTVVDPQFPARLRELRKARGLSQQALAGAAFMSKSYVSELENAIKVPGTGTARALDAALHADGELANMVGRPGHSASVPAAGASPDPRRDPASRPHADLLLGGRDSCPTYFPFQEFAMAAEESVRFTRRAGVTVNAELLEQLNAEIRGAAMEYLHRPPYAMFTPINTLRREVFSILERHVPSVHLSDLYLYAGQLTALLAHASADLGQPVIAEAHARTAWLCAELAEHDPLRAYVRWVQANIAYWAGQFRRAAETAADGRRYAVRGSSLLRLASQEARAWAAYGDQGAVARALSLARDERDRTPDAAGEVGAFYFSVGKAAYYASEAWLAAGGADNARRARDDAQEARALLTAEPQPSPELVAAARLDLAAAQVALGDLESAGGHLTDVLTLPVERRTVPVTQRVARIRAALSASAVAPALVSVSYREQIEVFLAYPATRELTT